MSITGILSQKHESAEDVRNLVKSVIKESGCEIPDIALDRAHRIAKYFPSEKNVRSVIVKHSLHLDIELCSIELEKTCLKMEGILIQPKRDSNHIRKAEI